MAYNNQNRKATAKLTKQKIYDAAKALFASRDYNAVSVDAIVQAAGVSKGGFYVHFVSKDALFAALVNDYVIQLDADYQGYLNSFADDAPAEFMLLSLIGKIADVLTEDIGRGSMQAVYKAQITGEYDVDVVSSYNRDIYQLFRQVLERGISRGEFETDLTPDMLARHLMLAIRGVTYEWCIRFPDFDYKAEALAHFTFLLKGLRARS
jgi:AcrR family transcriptional regulator